jgi:hypothetical protein
MVLWVNFTMDKFEQILQNLEKMPKKEKAKLIEAEKAKCMCGTCPTYTKCAINAKEGFYCTVGKSFMCITFDKGCTCRTCPVTSDLGLKYHDYCLKGSEKAQRYEKTVWGAKIL